MRNPSFIRNRVVIITFDENGIGDIHINNRCDETQLEPINYAFLGPNVCINKNILVHYTHYDMLRFIEEHFNLGTLGCCGETAKPIRGIFCNCTKNEKKQRLKKFIEKIDNAIVK